MDKQLLEQEAREFVRATTLYGGEKAPIGSSARSYFETELRCYIAGATSSSTVKSLEIEVDRLKSGIERIERICLRDVTDMHKDFKHIYNIIQSITKTVNNDRE